MRFACGASCDASRRDDSDLYYSSSNARNEPVRTAQGHSNEVKKMTPAAV
jgi:hypothetical protein